MSKLWSSPHGADKNLIVTKIVYPSAVLILQQCKFAQTMDYLEIVIFDLQSKCKMDTWMNSINCQAQQTQNFLFLLNEPQM